ncbi:hypothetical protein [Streptomyces sp. NPDC046939]|uniref:hypothetical protein n=1 Tax=Streptomyces sp. NPDC046939 TaxID=3155376 RepID=UPI003405F717
MRFRTAVATGALTLAASAALASAPALAASPEPSTGPDTGTGTVVLSDESYDRLLHADQNDPLLLATDPSYREAWLFCLSSPQRDHVERNGWGKGYVCIPDGAVQ